MADRKSATGSEDPRVSAALADYLQRVDRGEPVSVDDFLAQHAEIAGELRSLLVTSEELANLQPAGPVAPPGPEVSTRSVAEQNVETVAPQRVQKGASAETLLQRLPDTFGRYRIVRPLGSGAMGDVYLAEDSQLHRKVALKTPSFDADETGELLERFYREARSAAVLRHSNICPVFDVGEINGRHYISMAYIEGQPLSAYIRPDKPQPERQALAVIRKLALALQDAHDHGIIHRDLKPGNVMIDRKGEPIVMDFGLARPVQSEAGARLTQSGMLVGSPAYMSPEQVEGDPSILTPSTDQYSLGVMLYELLTGNLPFRGGVTAVIAAILTKQPTPPGQLRADLDPRIEALCLKMMSKSPGERFKSLRDVADAISTILKSDPARPAERSTTKAAPVAETAPVAKPKRSPTAAAAATPAAAAAASITASNVESLLDAANKCMRKHDYEQVVSMLDAIPERKRTDQVRALLAKAQELSDEVAFLLSEIDEALQLNDNEALGKKADALLKLKPKHHKALQIKEELSRYGKGRVWQAGGWTPDGRRIGEGSWIPWLPLSIGACVFGISLLCVMLYLRVGDAVVRVRINHPDVEVGIQDRTLNIRSATQDIKVEPGEDTLKVSFQGADFETQKFTLNKGQNPAIVIELLDKTLSAKFGDLSIGEWPVEPQASETPEPEASAVANTSPVEASPPDAAPPAVTSAVPADAVEFQRHSYKYFGERLSWKEAKARCETMGGHLPIIETASENAFLDQLAQQGFPPAGRSNKEAVWIGGTDEVKEGDWRWVDGSRVTFSNWLKAPNNGPGTQPNNKEGREHYALIWLSTDPNRASGQWSDQPNVSEQHVAHFICEWDEPAALTTSDAGGIDLFNGRDLTGWTVMPASTSSRWQIVDQALRIDTPEAYSHVWTDKTWSDFRITLEYRLGPEADAGLLLRSPQQFGKEQTALEIVLGEGKESRDPQGRPMNGGLWLLDAGASMAVPADRDAYRSGEWNRLDVTIRGKSLTGNLNGQQVLDRQLDEVAEQKPQLRPLIGRTAGFIGLQGWQGRSEYRNVRIHDLSNTGEQNTAGWTELFNGRDLTGWRKIGVESGWSVQNGEIIADVGTQGGSAGWLMTERDYSDFELQLEFAVSELSDSGVAFRCDPNQTGPQAVGQAEIQIVDELDPAKLDQLSKLTGARSGGLAGLQADRTLPPLERGKWHTMNVYAQGRKLQVKIDGVMTVDADLDQHVQRAREANSRSGIWRPGGPIGLQKMLGRVRFRSIRIRELTAESADADGAGWTELFNGRDLTGWKETPNEGKWRVDAGVLSGAPGVGWIATDRDYSDFELELEYRLPAGGNSGIFLRIPDEGAINGGDFLELQLFDDPSGKVEVWQRNGALYAVSGPSQSVAAPAGQWNQAQIRAVGSEISVTINGTRVNEVNVATASVVGPPKKHLKRPSGHIGLQRHKNPGNVEFRNVRIRELSSVPAATDGWTDLFNGRDLTGWEIVETTGPRPADQSVHTRASGGWTVNPATRELVCDTDKGGWLKSQREYGDFELQLEFNLPPEGNSGILIRTPETGHLPKTGMEVQLVDPALAAQGDQPQSPTGSIQYSGARTDIRAMNPPGQWNTMTIRCTGDEVIVNINGRRVNEVDVTADPQLKDRPRRGFVGLYNWLGKAKGTRFRNVRIRETSPESAETANGTDLFNGRDLTGWTIQTHAGAPTATPFAADGDRQVLVARAGGHSWLITDETYRDFKLTLDWRFPSGGSVGVNGSGVVVRAEGLKAAKPDPDEIEVIEVDLNRNATGDAEPGAIVTHNTRLQHRNGSTSNRGAGMIGTTSSPGVADDGSWNTCEIVCQGDRLTVTMNGVTVNEATGMPQRAGNIGLRNQNSDVEFRNIRIQKL